MAIPLVLKTTQDKQVSTDISSERMINCFISNRQSNLVGKQAVIGSHGYTQLGTANVAPSVRGCVATADGTSGYKVTANNVYLVNSGGAETYLGTIGTSSGIVSMVIGVFYVLIVDGNAGYTVSLANGQFAQVTDANFPSAPTVVTHLDGYYCVIGQSSGTYQLVLSNINDATSYNVLNILETPLPGSITSVIASNEELYLISTNNCQVYSDLAGATGFPLTRSYVPQFGSDSPFSVATIRGVLYFIARTSNSKAILVRASGSIMQPIVNEDLNRILQSWTTLTDVFAYAYEDAGQQFYEFTSPTMNQTFTYCIDTNNLFQKMTSDGNRFIASSYMFLNNTHVIGDRSSGNLYTMSLSTYTENGGNAIIRNMTLPTIFDGNNWIKTPMLRVLMDTSQFPQGVANAVPLTLQTSEDGGHNYQTLMTDTIIQNQEYCQFEHISAARRLTHQFQFQQNLPFYLVGIYAYVESSGR